MIFRSRLVSFPGWPELGSGPRLDERWSGRVTGIGTEHNDTGAGGHVAAPGPPRRLAGHIRELLPEII